MGAGEGTTTGRDPLGKPPDNPHYPQSAERHQSLLHEKKEGGGREKGQKRAMRLVVQAQAEPARARQSWSAAENNSKQDGTA